MNKTVDCTFVSVWDGGIEIVSPATYDTDTGLISDIQTAPLSASMLEECQHLEREYIIVNCREYAVERGEDDEYYAIRTYDVFFARSGYAQVKAKSAQDAIRIANRECSLDGISWDEDWNATDAQLEDEDYGK